MNLSSKAIDHPRIVLVAVILVAMLALMAAIFIPVQRAPAISKAVILVTIPYHEALPTEVEDQITRKIEDTLQGLSRVDFISSTSLRGSSVTQVIFLDGVKPKEARGEVKDLIDQVRSELPVSREVQPIVTDIDFESAPIMLVTLTAPPGMDDGALKQITEEVQKDLEGIEGVANTQIFGGREREIHVDVNLDLLSHHGLSLLDVRQSILQGHSTLPGGTLETDGFDERLRNASKFDNLADIRKVVIRRDGDRLIRIQDVAQVKDSYRRLKNLAQLDGRNCATIIVNKESDINTLGAAQAIKKHIAEMAHQYHDIKFSTTRDTSEEISVMFRVLGSSFIFGAMLVLVVLAWSMGLRMSVLVLIAVPFSTAVALAFLYFNSIPVSNMVIFSFILVLGMVVDGAIIVAENIHRHIERGEDPVTASKLGIEEVAWPVIAADMTTVAAYLPMLLVPGIMGDFMSVMPKVVSVALLGSVLVDHFVIPVIASLWYRKRVDVPGGSESSHVGPIILEGNVANAGASRIRPNVGPFTRAYAVVLRGALANRWFVLAWSAIAIWGAVLLQKRVGFQFFPTSDRGQFEVKYELPLGYSIAETTEAARRITEPLAEMQKESDDLVHFVSAIGASGGLASRLENDPATGPEFGTVMVQLKSPLDRRRHENDFIRELRGRIKPLPGMKVTIHQVEEGPPGGADVAVRFSGKQLSRLGELAETLSERLREIDGTTDVRTDYRPDSPEIVVAPRPDKVGIFDMDKQQVARAVQTAVLGDTTIELSLEDEDVTLRIQADAQYRKDVGAIQRVVLTGPTGRKSMIGELADFRRGVGLYSVNRYNRRRATVTACDVQDPVTPDSVFGKLRKEVLPQLGFKPLPPTPPAGVGAFFADVSRQVKTAMGVEIEEDQAVEFTGQPGTPAEGVRATFTGQNEERDKNFAYLLNSMAIAVVLILAILVLQFNSYRQAFVVLLTVPLSFVGVVIGMWVCDFPFSLASFIGLVSLTGVVVNDAIVMVDFTNQARGRGMTVKQALMEAGVNRLRPVLLTTVTTIGGLLPLFLNLSGGAEFWQPLTGAVVFGLGFATILTLVVIPVAYSVVYNGADR